jgi:hypothetical protein
MTFEEPVFVTLATQFPITTITMFPDDCAIETAPQISLADQVEKLDLTDRSYEF